METHDEFRERIRREQRLAARLRLATERLEEAQRERIWAVVEAHQSGLSVRQIAAATGLSSSRVHQLLGSDESREIPRWLSQRQDQDAAPSRGRPDLKARLAGEMDPKADGAVVSEFGSCLTFDAQNALGQWVADTCCRHAIRIARDPHLTRNTTHGNSSVELRQ